MKRDRLTADEIATILELCREGLSDWDIHFATGHARTTIQHQRHKAGLPSHTQKLGRAKKRTTVRRIASSDDPAVALYRAEKARRSA